MAERRRRPGKVARIFRRELWTTVSRPGWIVSTLLLPLLPLFILALEGLVDPEKMMGGPEPAHVAVVDESGLLDRAALSAPTAAPPMDVPEVPGLNLPPALEAQVASRLQPRDRYLPYDSEGAARADLLSGREVCVPGGEGPCAPLTGYVVVPADWAETGVVQTWQVDREDDGAMGSLGARLPSVLRRALLQGRVNSAVAERAARPVASRRDHVLSPAGEPLPDTLMAEEIRRFVMPVLGALLLTVALFSGAGYLLLGLSEEKENRVLELLLSSVTPDELLAGKLLGIGTAGLLQFGLWMALVAVPLAFAAPLLGVSLGQIAWAVAFFLGAYGLYGALMLGVGAVADTARHAQQLSGVFTMLAVAPLVFNVLILQEPGGLFARILTFFPLTAPITVMLRMGSGAVATWELALALALLLGAGWLALAGAGRVFRASLLLYGQRPTPRTLLRWLRASA